MIFEHKWDHEPMQASYDLIQASRHALRSSPLNWKPLHVRGHQDQYTTFNQLDWRSQLSNVKIDSLAKVYWNDTYENHHPFYATPNGSWHLGHGSGTFANLDQKLMYEIVCHGPPLQTYWQNKQKRFLPSNPTIQRINFEVSKIGLRHLGLFR